VGTAFRRRRDGSYSATLHPAEIDLLASLVGQLLELLADGEPQATGPTDPLEHVLDLASSDPPSDPVLQRLFPDAYVDDEGAAGDFRRYTERGLRDVKQRNALVVLGALERAEPARRDPDSRHVVHVEAADAEAWMRALTDLRLALGTRLGLEQDSEPDWVDDADEPRRYVLGVYEWLGWLEDTLVHAVTR
jgi:hypothetical protein